MRARSATDDRVAEAAQRRLEALVAELGGHASPAGSTDATVARVTADDDADDADDAEDADHADGQEGGQPGGASDGTGEDRVDPGRHLRRPLPGRQRVASWAADRVPASLTGLRVDTRHLAVLGALLVTGLVLAGCAYLRATSGADPRGEVVAPRASGGVDLGSTNDEEQVAPTGAPSAGAATPAPGTATPGTSSASRTSGSPSEPEVVVDVEGKVRRPGIAVLPAGSRVVDALRAAGGARPRADLRALNLARVLVDGEQLLVDVPPASGLAAGALSGPPAPGATGATGAGGGVAGATPPGALVDLNTADQAALETLPGVGPVTAAAILQWRTEHGAFTSVDELLEVSGIGDATLAEIAPHVTV